MSKTKQAFLFPIDINYIESNAGIEVRLFCINKEKEKLILIDRSFKPYFYAIPKGNINYLHKKIKNLKIIENGKEIRVIKVKKVKKKEATALKVILKKQSHMNLFRKIISNWKNCELRETDISLINRYLIDKNICLLNLHKARINMKKSQKAPEFELKNIKMISPEHLKTKALALDIETNSKEKLNVKKDSIISIAFYGSNKFKKIITWKKYPNPPEYVKFVSGEMELLEETIKTIKTFEAEILTGYNSNAFDFSVILNRLNKYKIKNDFGWNESKLQIVKKGSKIDAKINGYVIIDCFIFIRNMLANNLKTRRLDLSSVAKEMIGYGKKDLSAEQIRSIWEHGNNEQLKKISEYNLRDAEITYKIFKKIFETLMEFTKLTGIHPQEISQTFYSRLVEWYLIKSSINRNKLVKNKPTYSEIKSRHKHTYTGAFVFEPIPGFYERLALLDFKSLYPSIIVAHNIDPQTLNCSCCRIKRNKIRIDSKDYHFCKKQKGFVPELIEALITRRARVKAILKKTEKSSESYQELKARQYALKIIANAFYGYLGFPASRWYSLECAKAITTWGRKYIRYVAKKAISKKLKTIYGDTDSVILQLKKEDLKDIKNLLKKINKKLPKPMKLEYEGFFKTGLFFSKKEGSSGAKKRYALMPEYGPMKIRGLESVRGDWSKLARNAQINVLKYILEKKDVKSAKKYISNLISKVRNRNIDLNLLKIKTRITKQLSNYKNKAPHITAAKMLERKKKTKLPGNFVEYIIKKGKGPLYSRVVLPEEAKRNDFDIEYYINNQIIRAVFKIFALFKISKEELINKQKQTDLKNW